MSPPFKPEKADLPVEVPADDGAELIARLQQAAHACCASCQAALCPHEILASIALGAGHAPRCGPCLARTLEEGVDELAASMDVYIQGRACYQTAWNWATSTLTMSGAQLCCALSPLVGGESD